MPKKKTNETAEKQIKVYLRIPPVADCGVGYYRQWLPLMTAREKGELDFTCHEFTWGKRGMDAEGHQMEPSDVSLSEAGKWADLIYYSRNDVPEYIAAAGGLRDHLKETQKKYKPIVLDIDDNVQATRPYNPGYRSFHPNSPNMVWNIKSLGVFDAITVSTDELKEFYSKYTDPTKIYVCPNSLNMKERDEVNAMDFADSKLFKKKDGEVRIGWTGSASHWENLKHIEPAVISILKKYPQTTFYYTGIFGDLFVEKELRDAGRIVNIGWADLKEWPKFNRECNFDIALAPLTDNAFNRAKSNLRILEYGSAKFPVICSPVRPYKCFTDKEVIFATEDYDWYEKIEWMINNAEERKELGENLYNRIKKDFNIDKNYVYWVDAIKKILKKKYE